MSTDLEPVAPASVRMDKPRTKRPRPRPEGRPCTVCNHPKRHEIEKALVASPTGAVSRRYGIPLRNVQRHNAQHVPAALVESSEAQKLEVAKKWLPDMEDYLARLLSVAENAEETSETIAGFRVVLEYMRTKGQHLKLIGDGAVNVWVAAGFKDEAEAQADRESREAIRSMSPHEIHAQFMEFERRYALESPAVERDYRTLLELCGGACGQIEEASQTQA